MNTMALVVAAVAALAIVLIAFGIASSGGGRASVERLDRYASGEGTGRPARPATGQGASPS